MEILRSPVRVRQPGPEGPERAEADRASSEADDTLIRSAVEVLRRSYRKGRTTVAAAVRRRSGRLFTGMNIEALYTPCAEPVAIGAAFAATERELSAMVAVGRRGRRFALLAPCGTCRQRLLDHAPEAYAIVPDRRGRPVRLAARASLPYAFTTFGR